MSQLELEQMRTSVGLTSYLVNDDSRDKRFTVIPLAYCVAF